MGWKGFLAFPGAAVLVLALMSTCAGSSAGTEMQARTAQTEEVLAGEPNAGDDWSLWTDGTLLRGANIYQRRVYPELDGPEFMGPGPVGPPYTQGDFNSLAAMGANYVQVSHPGLYTENPPYVLDEDIQDNLDGLLDMIAGADMYAVIGFRTGPGRSEFTFFWDEVGTWFDESYLNDSVWEDSAAQDAWCGMWRHTAERYRDHPAVAGYELMVEPNANDRLLDVWDPQEFHAQYSGTLYDWNQFFPRITAAVREVDAGTPVLVGGNGYSAVGWLPYVQPGGDDRTVYTVHQYEPYVYTHQDRDETELGYPGVFDADYDGADDVVDKAWLDSLLSTADTFAATHGVPIAVTEFGLVRWDPGAARFMDDEMDLFEQRGWNHALWVWDPHWEPLNQENDAFNFRHGPDPQNHSAVETSELIEVIKGYWGRNMMGPIASTWYFAEGCTGPGFQEYLCLGNFQDTAANVRITYMFEDGNTLQQYVTAPAESRTTINVNAAVGADKEVSCKVEADQAIVAERPMYFIHTCH